MQQARAKAEAQERKFKLAHSYQQLLDEFSNKDLKSVGNYTLGRLIGKGSFGKVYLATHKLTNGSKVVLKSAKKEDSNLAREIHHHRQFVHPHIARLYEVIVTESMVWLALEYCQGDELYNYLLKHGKLSVEKVQKTFTQLVGAVAYVHKQSCVHRDLKLENILLDKHENVKLVDFGFTREYEGKSNYLQTFCGTICYSAPEMLKGEKYAGEKVDVWSLGVILYALLCGELPFDDDDDDVTRRKILSEEPKYPDDLPPDALSLLQTLLSKRTLIRPALPDILSHPFLAEYAPQQQAILNQPQASPFSTLLEKEILDRMRSAGVNVDAVIDSVLSQRCDALSGWWALLLEKEQRKQARRERKRKERELEYRNSRRLSAASSRLERLATVGEEAGSGSSFIRLGDPPTPKSRGRTQRRSGHFEYRIEDFPGLKELSKANDMFAVDLDQRPPPPVDKDSVRSTSSSRHRRPIPPPKESVLRSARSRGSTLHLVTTSDALAAATGDEATSVSNTGSEDSHQKTRKKPSQMIIAHWKNMTHWIVENTRRTRHAGKRGSHSTPNLLQKPTNGKSTDGKDSKDGSPRPQTSKYPNSSQSGLAGNTSDLAKGRDMQNTFPAKRDSAVPHDSGGGYSNARNFGSGSVGGIGASGGVGSAGNGSTGALVASPVSTNLSTPTNPPGRLQTASNSYKRHSLSPSPLTPRSAIRRSSANHGLRGRKSTSSSVSSIRSIHHHHQHSHSKASSTSSNGSVSTAMSKSTLPAGRSPHHSVKVLPATPTATSFPSNLRIVLGSGQTLNTSATMFNEGMPMDRGQRSPSPFNSYGGAPGTPVMFAKRKRNLFKGPMLAFGGSSARSTGSGSHSRSASATGLGRRSGEITIEEEDEEEEDAFDEEDEDADVEEVEAFSPVIQGPGERVEEIYEDVESNLAKESGSEAVSPVEFTTPPQGSKVT